FQHHPPLTTSTPNCDIDLRWLDHYPVDLGRLKTTEGIIIHDVAATFISQKKKKKRETEIFDFSHKNLVEAFCVRESHFFISKEFIWFPAPTDVAATFISKKKKKKQRVLISLTRKSLNLEEELLRLPERVSSIYKQRGSKEKRKLLITIN
ncbi:unnamed protein product, partial [Arabidopsis halleri]